MKRTPLLLSLALLGSLSLFPLATAAEKVPTAKQVCTGLTKAAKKANGKNGAEAKGRLALAAAIRKLEKAPEDVNLRSKGKGLTPLMVATALGEKNAVRWLLAIGADPYIQDNDKKDSFARTQDKAITALLHKHSLATWEEALKHLESIPEKDWLTPADSREKRADIMKACQQLSQGQESDIHPYTLAYNFTYLGDHKMLSFLARQGKEWNYHGMCSHYHAAVTSPHKEKRVAAFNLLESLACMGEHPGMEGMYWLKEGALHEDAKAMRWVLNYLGALQSISWGAKVGMMDLVKMGIEQAKREKADTKKFQIAIVAATEDAFLTDNDELLDFLMTQDNGGMCGAQIYYSTFSSGKIEKFKAFRAKRPANIVEINGYELKLYREHMDEQEVLKSSAWNLYGIDSYKYLVSILKTPIPQSSLCNMIWNIAYDGGLRKKPHDLEFIKFLLEQGADPTPLMNDEGQAKAIAKWPELHKMLQEAMEKKK